MPPRLAIVAIVLFWGTATSWLFYREYLPLWRVGRDDPPAYNVSLIDEIGANTTSWRVYLDGQEAGMGTSKTEHRKDRTFVFYSDMTFNSDKKLFDDGRHLFAISKVVSTNHVTDKGELLEMGFEVSAEGEYIKLAKKFFGVEPNKFGIRAKVEDGLLHPRLLVNGEEKMTLNAIPVSKNGLAFNPTHVGEKITDLWAGKSWRIPVLNPISFRPGEKQDDNSVVATVSEDTLTWSKKEVPCYRIDFKQPGDDSLSSGVEAASWVRRSDGLVLKQSVVMKPVNLNLQLIRVDEK